jgi:pyrrolidone-carboxylate peptidase
MDILTPININGYDTYFSEAHDDTGNYLLIAIPDNASKDISDICGTFVCGHLIQQIGYQKANGKIAFIKAYY